MSVEFKQDNEWWANLFTPDALGANLAALSAPQLNFQEQNHRQLRSPHATIHFTEVIGDCSSTITDISVMATLASGKEIARYSLASNPTGSELKTIRHLLSNATSSGLSTLDVLRSLHKITKNQTELRWTAERIRDEHTGVSHVAPMEHVIPSFSEFVRDPSAIQNRFASYFSTEQARGTVETFLDADRNMVVAELKTAQPFLKLEPFIVKGPSSHTRSTTNHSAYEDLLLISYEIHQTLQEQGIEVVRDALIKKQVLAQELAPCVPSDPREVAWTLESSARQYPDSVLEKVVELSSGARLEFVVRPHIAHVQLFSGPSQDHTSCCWIFEGPYPADPFEHFRLQQVAQALTDVQFPNKREEALRSLFRLRDSFVPRPCKLDSILSPQSLMSIGSIQGISVSTVSPCTGEDLLEMCLGRDLIEVRLSNPGIRKLAPEVFDLMRVALRDGEVTEIQAFNHVQGRFDFVVSPTITAKYGDMLTVLSNELVGQNTNGRWRFQQKIQEMCEQDPDTSVVSWSPTPWNPAVPPPWDHHGQALYDVGSQIVTAFASINYSKPDDARVDWIREGEIEVELGLPCDPYIMSLKLQRDGVSRVSIYEQHVDLRSTEPPSRHLIGVYDCNLTLSTNDRSDGERLYNTLVLFNSLVREAAEHGSRFQNSQLLKFLDEDLS